MPEHLGKPQLRPVSAMLGAGGRAQCIWLHEGDVPWLVTYLADEVATGGVGPIEDSDGEEQDECEEASMTASLDGAAVAAPSDGAAVAAPPDGAAVAAPSEGDIVTPTKRKKGEPKIR